MRPLKIIAILLCGFLLTTAAQAAQTFSDCPNCPEMIVLPAGNFAMGGDTNDEEKPSIT
jgi:formylglycine-generating enzyme required for sulfatase activity